MARKTRPPGRYGDLGVVPDLLLLLYSLADGKVQLDIFKPFADLFAV